MQRPPIPPIASTTAMQKVRAAKDSGNTSDPATVAPIYAPRSDCRNRAEIPKSREENNGFPREKRARKLDFRMIRELWIFDDSCIAERIASDWRNESGQWSRFYRNVNPEFDSSGPMAMRCASIHDQQIAGTERKFHHPQRPGPQGLSGHSDLGL